MEDIKYFNIYVTCVLKRNHLSYKLSKLSLTINTFHLLCNFKTVYIKNVVCMSNSSETIASNV